MAECVLERMINGKVIAIKQVKDNNYGGSYKFSVNLDMPKLKGDTLSSYSGVFLSRQLEGKYFVSELILALQHKINAVIRNDIAKNLEIEISDSLCNISDFYYLAYNIKHVDSFDELEANITYSNLKDYTCRFNIIETPWYCNWLGYDCP